MKKKILLIGKNGFFGKSLKKSLKFHNLKLIGRKDELEKINLKKFDVIINCAADIYNEKKMFYSNTLLVYRLLENYLNQKSKAKIIHFGSSGEYGNSKLSPSENQAINPCSIYAGTKAAATMLLQSFSKEFKIKSVILRTGVVYGPYENQSRLLPFIFRHLLLKNKLTIFKGHQDYLYIYDLCKIIDQLVTKWGIKGYGEIINISSGKTYENKQVLKICEKITKIKSKAKVLKSYSQSNHNKYYNYQQKALNTKKMNNLNFKSKTNIKSGILKYWNEIHKNKDLKEHTMNFTKNFFNKW